MTTEALTYRIAYNRIDHDYTCFVTIDDVEQTIGSRPDHAAAESHCRAYLYDYYADNHTPEVAAEIAVKAFAPEPDEIAWRYVHVNWQRKHHEDDFSIIAAQVLLPLAHLKPWISSTGDHLHINNMVEITAPPNDHAIVICLIDAQNEIGQQLPSRPDCLYTTMHIAGELYTVGHNGPSRGA